MNKLITYIKGHKGRVLIVTFIVTFLLYVATGQPIPFSGPERSVNPTPTTTPAEGMFSLTKTSLTGPVMKSVWSVEPITLYFDDVVDMTTFDYTVSPSTDTFIKGDIEEKNPISVTIIPRTGWKSGVSYTIRVDDGLRSVSNKKISEQITIRFRREVPSAEELDLPDHAF